MASTTPTEEPIAQAETPAAAPVAAPAKAEVKPAPKTAKPVVARVKAKAAKPARVATAGAATPPAKNKAAAKTAVTSVIETIKPAIVSATARAKTVAAKEANIMEATIKNAAERAKTLFTDANAKSTQALAEINEFGKGNIEAMVESGKIAAKGVEAFGQDSADYGRRQFESATAALKSLSSVKSPTDFFKLQSDYFRASFDSLVAQTSKNTETVLKLAGEVAQPIQNRVAVAVEKVKVAA
ncbi:phasin family protein [Sphingomonas sp. PB4P5]